MWQTSTTAVMPALRMWNPTVLQPFMQMFSSRRSTLKHSPAADPRMVKLLAGFKMDVSMPDPPINHQTSYFDKLSYFNKLEHKSKLFINKIFSGLPLVEGVINVQTSVVGEDGNEIPLHISAPEGHNILNLDGKKSGRGSSIQSSSSSSSTLPCVYHIHGGGMSVYSAADVNYRRWRDELAALGVVVVGVEFRNCAGQLGPHPFPSGLVDCVAGLKYVHEHRKYLNISNIVVAGESGGGNLALALALKMQQLREKEEKEEKENGSGNSSSNGAMIDGVFASCPFISGFYGEHNTDEDLLPSLKANDGMFINSKIWGLMVDLYVHSDNLDHLNETKRNPLAWPYWAEESALRHLPPHIITVNELDGLKDEGIEYYRKLLRAGVSARCITINGTCHAADMIFRKAMPDVYEATLHNVKQFALSLSPKPMSSNISSSSSSKSGNVVDTTHQ